MEKSAHSLLISLCKQMSSFLRKFLRWFLHRMYTSIRWPINFVSRKLFCALLIIWNIVFVAVYVHFCLETNSVSLKTLRKDFVSSASTDKDIVQVGHENACRMSSLGEKYHNVKEYDHADKPFCRISGIDEKICNKILARFKTSDNNNCVEEEKKICFLIPKMDNGGLIYDFKCSIQDRLCNGHLLSFGYINSRTGVLEWVKHPKNDNVTELFLRIAEIGKQSSSPFVFIRCGVGVHLVSQLLIFPSSFVLKKKEEHAFKTISRKPLNINLVLLDSVSRPHFFRSLPQTIAAIKQINSQKNSSVILDFDLYQAVKARTYENLYLFFTGKTPEMSNDLLSNTSALPPLPVHQLFKDLKLLGYQTMWQEDLCWLYEWGLVRNLKAHNEKLPLSNRWAKLQEILKVNAIDNLGVTLCSCEILHKYGLQHPFLHPPKLCYNGKFHHEYMLNFLQDSFKTVSKESSIFQPMFALSIFNTPHEHSGLRLQTMDKSLKLFVQEMAENQDTVSVLFSDHGNTYGLFPNTIHGRFEQFNPSLFIIIPKNIQKLIGNSGMDTLINNQHRLLTIKDLRNLIIAFTKIDTVSGVNDNQVFLPIPDNRTCDDLSILDTSLCICEGWSSKVASSPLHAVIAEFALGNLNKLIQKQVFQSGLVNVYSPCQRLVAEKLQEVHERRLKESVIIQMDLIVQYEEIFNVEVEMSLNDNMSFSLELISFSRVSAYGVYKECSDHMVDLKLCICDQAKNDVEFNLENRKPVILHWEDHNPVLGVETQAKEMHAQCLYILTREYPGGVVFEAASRCQFVQYTVNMKFTVVNMRLVENPIEVVLPVGSIQYLTVLIPADPGLSWKWSYNLNYSWRQL